MIWIGCETHARAREHDKKVSKNNIDFFFLSSIACQG